MGQLGASGAFQKSLYPPAFDVFLEKNVYHVHAYVV